jgi:hypothetical protein
MQRHGPCEPRGGGRRGDEIVANVAEERAHEDRLRAFVRMSNGERRGPLLIEAHMCVVLQRALHQELVLACGSEGVRFSRVHAVPCACPTQCNRHWCHFCQAVLCS